MSIHCSRAVAGSYTTRGSTSVTVSAWADWFWVVVPCLTWAVRRCHLYNRQDDGSTTPPFYGRAAGSTVTAKCGEEERIVGLAVRGDSRLGNIGTFRLLCGLVPGKIRCCNRIHSWALTPEGCVGAPPRRLLSGCFFSMRC